MNKVSSFIKQFTAALTGDDAAAQAAKNWRKAESALKVQINLLEGQTVDLEEKVEDAQEAENQAMINSGKDIDKNRYVGNLLTAHNGVLLAKENLADHLAKLAYLQEVLTALRDDEVPAGV